MRNIALTVLFAVVAMGLQGQDRQQMKERLESQKIAYITTELDLSTEEAQRFWPIYNDYNKQVVAGREKNRTLKSTSQIEDLTEAEATALVESILAQQEAEIMLKKAYAAELKSVISSKKIAQLFILERQFKDKLMSKIRRKMRRKNRDTED